MFDWLIVGAGFAGSVLAERIASQRQETVLLIDKRDHIGGSAYDYIDKQGILVHRYGPHIFHTNSKSVFNYLSQFTEWRPYEHRVAASVGGRLFPIPINRETLNQLYDLTLTTDPEVEAFLATKAQHIRHPMNAEDIILRQVGRELFEIFFKNYTFKQWGIEAAALHPSVTSRIPVRTNADDRYFTDTYQFMPKDGYSSLFTKILDQPNITLALGESYASVRDHFHFGRTIFTGPIDEFFEFRLGRLPYRAIQFEHRQVDQQWHQPVAVINYPGYEKYTRIAEYKHITGQFNPKTSISYEYPGDVGEPSYPIPSTANFEKYTSYRKLAIDTPNVLFAGRLATYRYYNMDQVIAQSLSVFSRIDK